MARRGKRAKTKRTPLSERLQGIDWLRVRRGVVAGLWVLAVAGVVVGWMLGVPRLRAHAASRPVPPRVTIAFNDAPAWMGEDLEAQLAETVDRQLLRRDVFDRGELVAVREALRATGWFDAVHQVRRVEAGRIEIDATFTTPFAVIRDRDGDHLVDPVGRLLPRTYPAGSKPQFIALINARYTRPAGPGRLWEGGDITAALRLLRVLYQQPWREQVAAIDLAGYMRSESLTLISDAGARIVWGSPPGEAKPLEALLEQKLQYLEHNMQQHGRIDRSHPGTLDITSPTEMVVR